MNTPTVSVIIPAYNGARYLGKAIQSVLDQTYSNFELIIVNDLSPDNTTEIVEQFVDPRIKYIVHENNLGVNQARNTGVDVSTGDIIALLDQDDFIHPEKLQSHVSLLEQNPDVGFTYNARFELNYSAETIREIWRPPLNISLVDLVLSFPIAPSDALIRRKWAIRINPQKHDLSWTGGEIAVFGGLLLDGCKFACVDRALNYRRHHTGRVFKDLKGGCESEINCQTIIFDDPRCPEDVLAVRNTAHANIYMFWAYRAFAQNSTDLGQEFLRKAAQWNPSIFFGQPCEYVNFLVVNCTDDENLDHKLLLKNIFAQLPPEMLHLSGQLDWAIARGYLMKATRALMWNCNDDGRRYFQKAVESNANVDQMFIEQSIQIVLNYEQEFGEKAAQSVLKAWVPFLKKLAGGSVVRRIQSLYSINRAFEYYNAKRYASVLQMIFLALLNNPKLLINRGVLSIFFRSIKGLLMDKIIA